MARKAPKVAEDPSLREHLLKLLESRAAHVDSRKVLRDLPVALAGRKPEGAPHTPWQILEHLRIAQWDILEFSRNPHYVSPPFPEGYWPESTSPPDDAAWKKSVNAFHRDRKAIAKLVADKRTNLHAPLPHGDGQTILREALLVADHNAYHLGQLVLLRRLLEAWKE